MIWGDPPYLPRPVRKQNPIVVHYKCPKDVSITTNEVITMTNQWLTNQLGNLLAKRDTLRRSLGQMRRELIGDDFETVHLKPKDADIVLQNYARDYQEFDQTVSEITHLFDNHVLLDDELYPMSTTALNRIVNSAYGFTKVDRMSREVSISESFEQLLQVYDADDSELAIHLRDQLKQTILRIRKFASDNQ